MEAFPRRAFRLGPSEVETCCVQRTFFLYHRRIPFAYDTLFEDTKVDLDRCLLNRTTNMPAMLVSKMRDILNAVSDPLDPIDEEPRKDVGLPEAGETLAR